MLFNSLAFLLVFLPAAVAVHALVERFRPDWRLGALIGLSFVFYGLWDLRFAPLLGTPCCSTGSRPSSSCGPAGGP